MCFPVRSLVRSTLFLLSFATASAQGLVGSWTWGDPSTSDTGVISFFANGYFLLAQDTNSTDVQFDKPGMERGSYTWNSATGAFSATVLRDTNATLGLSDIGPSATLTKQGQDIVFSDGINSLTLGAVPNSGLLGSWYLGDPSTTNAAVITFFSSGYFLFASDTSINTTAEQPGMERGTYSWDLVTGAFTQSLSQGGRDTNGNDFGVFLSFPVSRTITLADANTLTLTETTDSTVAYSLYRVNAIPEPSTWAAIAGCCALGLAGWRRRARPA